MILVFSLGLWGILRVGSRLHAARDVAGEWDVKGASAGAALPQRMTLIQSGRFLNATLHDSNHNIKLRGTLDGKHLVLKGVNEDAAMDALLDDSGTQLVWLGQGWRASRAPKETLR